MNLTWTAMAAVMLASVSVHADDDEYPAAVVGGVFEGRPVATELSPEVKRAIDGARKLYETPGAIVNRHAIYKILDVHPSDLRASMTTEGDYRAFELLIPNQANPDESWAEIKREHSRFKKSGDWVSVVRIEEKANRPCYVSRLVEDYWGKPFVYVRLGVHTPFEGDPHGGIPYDAGFLNDSQASANVSFTIGRGGCLVRISAGNLFKLSEYSDDNVLHK